MCVCVCVFVCVCACLCLCCVWFCGVAVRVRTSIVLSLEQLLFVRNDRVLGLSRLRIRDASVKGLMFAAVRTLDCVSSNEGE